MNRTLLLAGAAWVGAVVLWTVALTQLGQPAARYSAIPDRSTQTQFPGP
jgi:hypothetical protein